MKPIKRTQAQEDLLFATETIEKLSIKMKELQYELNCAKANAQGQYLQIEAKDREIADLKRLIDNFVEINKRPRWRRIFEALWT